MKRYYILIFIISVLVSSCKDFQDFSPHSKLILKNEKMMFRGIEFDKNKATITELESSQPIEEYPDYLRYKYSLEKSDTTELELEYFFNNDNRLDMIIAYYTIENEDVKNKIFDELLREFTKRFGPGEKDELGWYTWKFKDQIGIPGQIEIILNQESNDGFQGIDIEFVKYYEFEQNMSLEDEKA